MILYISYFQDGRLFFLAFFQRLFTLVYTSIQQFFFHYLLEVNFTSYMGARSGTNNWPGKTQSIAR